MGNSTHRVRIGEARLKMAELSAPTIQSKLRFDVIIQRFERFVAKGWDVEFIDEITPELAEAFVRAKGSTGEPSTATMHIRRSSLRALFRIARLEFSTDGDPTMYMDLPPRTTLPTRPLEEDEVLVGRSYSQRTFSATRQPAAWELGEATATTSELPQITVEDLDLDYAHGPRVWLHGSKQTRG